MARIPEFMEALEKMREIHEKKNEDYSNADNPFSNFDDSEYGLRMFTNPRDQVFIWPIFCKLSRLANLLNHDHSPNNEAVEDSQLDIANYILLWRADYLRRRNDTAKRKEVVEAVKNLNPEVISPGMKQYYYECSERGCGSYEVINISSGEKRIPVPKICLLHPNSKSRVYEITRDGKFDLGLIDPPKTRE